MMLDDDAPTILPVKRPHDLEINDEEPDAKQPRLDHAPSSPVDTYKTDLHGILGVPHQTIVPRIFATREGTLVLKPTSDGPGRVIAPDGNGVVKIAGRSYRAAQLVYECIADVILSEREARALVHRDGNITNCAFVNLLLDAECVAQEIPAFSEEVKDSPYMLHVHGEIHGTHPSFPGLSATSMGLLVRRRGATGGWRILSDKTPKGPEYTVLLANPVAISMVIDLDPPVASQDPSEDIPVLIPTKAPVAQRVSYRANKLIYEAVHKVLVPENSYITHVNGNSRDNRPSNLLINLM